MQRAPAPTATPLSLWIVYGAFLTAIPVYIFLVFWAIPSPQGGGRLPIRPELLMGMAAMASVVGAVTIPRMCVRFDESVGPNRYLGQVQLHTIVQAAFWESIAIYGVIAYLLGGSRLGALGFMLLSEAALLTMLPGLTSRVDRYKQMLLREGAAQPPPTI
jgi:hypothetical protein